MYKTSCLAVPSSSAVAAVVALSEHDCPAATALLLLIYLVPSVGLLPYAVAEPYTRTLTRAPVPILDAAFSVSVADTIDSASDGRVNFMQP